MYSALILPDIQQMIEQGDRDGLRAFCEDLYPGIAAEILERLDPEDAWKVLSTTSPERQAEIFGFFSMPFQLELVRLLYAKDRQKLSRLIEAMAPDDRADLLERLPEETVEEILPLIAQAERADIRRLLSFPEGSAGAIMTTEYASLPEDITVREALERLRLQAPDRETIYYVYITDADRRLRGLVSLRQLILAKPDAKLSDIMEKDVVSVRVDDDQEEVARTLAKYDFIAIPVTDDQNRLVGIVTHDDVIDVLQEEATEDAQLAAAITPLEDPYLSTPIPVLARKRVLWLVILLGTASITAAVLNHYSSANVSHEWLVMFIPMVMATGGNCGTQSAALVIRMLALVRLTREENMRLAGRELVVALILGSVLATVALVAASLFVSLAQALVVATTVFLVVLIGTIVGAMLPVLFNSLGMDPALMSNPLITSLVDVLGIVTYYNVAKVMIALFGIP
ncbi:MAG: magnesium transporter [Planctomycetota bacterium]|nr:MAG: magnesium transporter [Planctomycetota bacterium]